jgi:hypothetical protein
MLCTKSATGSEFRSLFMINNGFDELQRCPVRRYGICRVSHSHIMSSTLVSISEGGMGVLAVSSIEGFGEIGPGIGLRRCYVAKFALKPRSGYSSCCQWWALALFWII